MSALFMFNAVAYFTRSVAGRIRASTTEQGRESLFAETTESAARMWLWRLSADERAVVHKIIIWPPKPRKNLSTYAGPTIVYARRDGRLSVIEERHNAMPVSQTAQDA